MEKSKIISRLAAALHAQEVMVELNPTLAKEHGFAVAELRGCLSFATKESVPTPAWGADKLRVLIEDVKIPVTVISREIGISRTSIYKIFSGQNSMSCSTVDKVVDFVKKISREIDV